MLIVAMDCTFVNSTAYLLTWTFIVFMVHSYIIVKKMDLINEPSQSALSWRTLPGTRKQLRSTQTRGKTSSAPWVDLCVVFYQLQYILTEDSSIKHKTEFATYRLSSKTETFSKYHSGFPSELLGRLSNGINNINHSNQPLMTMYTSNYTFDNSGWQTHVN